MMKIIESRKWTLVGLLLLIATTLVMGWLVGQFFPGSPRTPLGDTITAKYPSRYDTGIEARETVVVEKGESITLEEVTQGFSYTGSTFSDSDVTKETTAPAQKRYGPFEMSILDAKLVSEESYRELYPDFPLPDTSTEPRYFGSDLPGICFLVTINLGNPSDSESVQIPELALWSEDLNLEHDHMGAGAYSFTPAGNAQPASETGSQGRDWSYDFGVTLAPGESREVVVPYYVYKNSFMDETVFDDIDLSRFALDVNDYKLQIRYRFWLG